LARCFFGSINFLITSIAMKTLPLSIFMIILSTNPFFTALLQYFWINQLITVYDAVSMVGSFIGIVLIGVSAPQKISSETSTQSNGYLLAIFFVLPQQFFKVSFMSPRTE